MSGGAARFNNEQIRIVMVGKTGAGKSATGNTILGGDHFVSEVSFDSVTSECAKGYGEMDEQRVAVIDTPGVFDTETDEPETLNNIIQSIAYAAPGPHIFLIVIKVGRFTAEEKKSVEKIQKIFGKEANRYSMVLFTHGDLLEGKPIEELLSKKKDLQELVDKCNGQYHVFNNKQKDGPQVRELLKKIRAITEKNGGRHYTTDMFQNAEREIEKEKQRNLKEKEEERRREKKKLEKEIKEKYSRILEEKEKENRRVEAEREKKQFKAPRVRKNKEDKRKLIEQQDKQARQEAEESPSVRNVITALLVALGVITGGAVGGAAGARVGGRVGAAIGAVIGAAAVGAVGYGVWARGRTTPSSLTDKKK